MLQADYFMSMRCVHSRQRKMEQVSHRDNSHPIFCVLFAYLSDVDIDTGAHEYYRAHMIEVDLRSIIQT